MSGRRLSVVLAGVLLMGVMVALGIAQATAQDNPNSQPSTSKVAADAGSQSVQSTTVKKVLWAVVNSDGTLARGKGALSATQFSTGTYGVWFDRNVTKCVYTATIGRSADGVCLRRSDYDLNRAVERIRATGYPGAEDMAQILLDPPDPEWVATFFEQQAARD